MTSNFNTSHCQRSGYQTKNNSCALVTSKPKHNKTKQKQQANGANTKAKKKIIFQTNLKNNIVDLT